MRWLGGIKIFVLNKQVAEVIKQPHAGEYIIRNARPNDTVGICFSSVVKRDITDWLDSNYPGWVKG